MNWRLPAAIAVSAVLHLLPLVAWRVPAPAPGAASTIEFEMLAAVSPEPEPEAALEPEPEIETEPEPESEQAPAPSVPDPFSPDPPRTVPEEDVPVSDIPSRTVLNLEPPAIWDSLVDPEQPSLPTAGLEFNPALSAAVSSRIRERGRAGLLADRSRAVQGLSAEEYGRTGASGDVVKVDGRCFSLQETPELGAEPRWWMVKCLDVKTDPFRMAPLETDARGRVIAN